MPKGSYTIPGAERPPDPPPWRPPEVIVRPVTFRMQPHGLLDARGREVVAERAVPPRPHPEPTLIPSDGSSAEMGDPQNLLVYLAVFAAVGWGLLGGSIVVFFLR